MGDYTYVGLDKTGKRVTGSLTAPSEGELKVALRTKGIRPLRIQAGAAVGSTGPGKEPGTKTLKRTGGGVRVAVKHLVPFTRQLQVLINAGIPLVQALEILSEGTVDPTFKKVLLSVTERVTGGAYFWEALGQYPRVFSKIYVALIRAAEASGSLDQILLRLAKYQETSERLKRMVKAAMVYPTAVVIVGFLVIIVMLTFVIPQFESMLSQTGGELPLPTQIVITASRFFKNNAMIILPSLIGGGVLVMHFFRSAEGKALLDRVVFRLPLFGPLTQKAAVARFSRTFQTLLVSGVNLVDAMEICKTVMDHVVMEAALVKAKKGVEEGKSLGAVIGAVGVFPKMSVQMISVGESSGSLDRMLEKVADYYEDEVEQITASMSKLIEPIILVFLGGSVAGMLIAMYLPIFKLAGGAG